MNDKADSAWRYVFQVAGAATGFVVFLHLVGGMIVWARLSALNLPADQVVGSLPREFLLTTGTRALLIPLVSGSAAAAVVYLVGGSGGVGQWIPALSLFVAIAVVVLVVRLSWDRLALVALLGAALVAAAVYLTVFAAGTASVRRTAWTLFLAVALFGGVVAFLRAQVPPVKLGRAYITFKNGETTTGYYLAATPEDVYLIPGAFGRSVGRVLVVPRDLIANVSVAAGHAVVRHRGGAATRILARLTSGRRVSRREEEEFIVGVIDELIWRYPPEMVIDAVHVLRRRKTEFLSITQADRIPGGPVVDVADLLPGPRLYARRPAAVRGRFVGVAYNAFVPGTLKFFAMRSHHGEQRAFCAILRKLRNSPAPGTPVVVRAIPLAVGSTTVAGKAVRAIFMVCSALDEAGRQQVATGHPPPLG